MVHAMALGPLMPAIAADLKTSVALLGQISAASMLLSGLLGVLAGPLIDRFSRRRALGDSLIAVVISAVGMAVAPAYLPLLFAALIGAVGRTIALPVAQVIAGDQFAGDQQRRAVSWVMAGGAGAPIVGLPALTTVASLFDWRVALVSLAATTAVLVPLVHRTTGPETPDTGTRVSLQQFLDAYRPILRHRPTFGLFLAIILGNAGIWVMATYIGVYFAERHAYTTSQMGWVYFVIGITLLIGNLAAGGRVGELPLRPLVTIAQVVVGLLVAGLFMLPVTATAGLGLLAAMGLTVGVSGVAGVLLLMRESPTSRATTLTLNTVMLNLGIALGGMIGGVLLAVGDFTTLGWGALLSFGAAWLVWSTRDRTLPNAPAPTTALAPGANHRG